MRLILYFVYCGIVGAGLAGMGFGVLNNPLLFFAIDIPLVIAGYFLIVKTDSAK